MASLAHQHDLVLGGGKIKLLNLRTGVHSELSTPPKEFMPGQIVVTDVKGNPLALETVLASEAGKALNDTDRIRLTEWYRANRSDGPAQPAAVKTGHGAIDTTPVEHPKLK